MREKAGTTVVNRKRAMKALLDNMDDSDEDDNLGEGRKQPALPAPSEEMLEVDEKNKQSEEMSEVDFNSKLDQEDVLGDGGKRKPVTVGSPTPKWKSPRRASPTRKSPRGHE